MAAKRIAIFDTTLRDGEQSPGCSMDLAEKVRMAKQLETLGADIIEAGFPIASDGDFAAVEAVAAECREVTVAALCRTAEPDVMKAATALRGGASAHSYVRRDLGHSPRIQTEEDPRRSNRDDPPGGGPGARTMPRKLSSRRKTRRAATSIIFAKCWPPRLMRAHRSSICRTRWATPCRRSFRG